MFRATRPALYTNQEKIKENKLNRFNSKRSRPECIFRVLGAGSNKHQKSNNLGPTLLSSANELQSPTQKEKFHNLNCKLPIQNNTADELLKSRFRQTQLNALKQKKLLSDSTALTALTVQATQIQSVSKIFQKPETRLNVNLNFKQQTTLTSYKKRSVESKIISNKSVKNSPLQSLFKTGPALLLTHTSHIIKENAFKESCTIKNKKAEENGKQTSQLFCDKNSEFVDQSIESFNTTSQQFNKNSTLCTNKSNNYVSTTPAQHTTLLQSLDLSRVKAKNYNQDDQCMELSASDSTRPSTSYRTNLDKNFDTAVPLEDEFINSDCTSKLVIKTPDQFNHMLCCDRAILYSNDFKASTTCDVAAYGHLWLLHHCKREQLYQPWQLTLTGKIEKLRLGVTAMYWESAKYYAITPATIYVAISNFSRLLNSWSVEELEHPSAAHWALTAVVAYRLAFKLEESPETLWEVNNFWDIFPMFADWSIDRSESNLNNVEMKALGLLNNSMDIPLPPMFVSLYLNAGGWPENVAKDYRNLALYILGLCTFTSAKDYLLKNVVPSKMAAAALVLAIKIVNGDRASLSGVLPHLNTCPRNTLKFNNSNHQLECTCRYEFFPKRLKVYCNMEMSDIQPIIRGLSCLLRSKPEETYVLKHSFPMWGEHDWQ